jgi:polysaccharide chain length determinant protein (PEP-CTERM system associated)
MEQDVKTIEDILTIVKRRKWHLIWPAVGVFLLSAIIAFAWPPTYRSISTILIEEQEIPREYVMTTVSSYAEQRLQSINQRIMSSTRLTEIINRFNLYTDVRDKWTMEEIIDKMRNKDIKFETISADVIDRRTGRPTAATIAFSLAYEGRNPAVVQQVANVLASLYLEENLRVREQQTEGATKFMDDERKVVEEQMAAIDKQIAAFKRSNINTLPELSQYNLQALDRIEREIDQLNNQIKELQERDSIILRELRMKLLNLESRFTSDYPDVIKTKKEIAEMEKKLTEEGQDPENSKSFNPAIDSVRRQLKMAQAKRNDYQRRIATTPQVEESYRVLITQRNNLQAKYDDLTKKYMESKVASGLEKGQMGERFTLIDAARLPEKPVKPNIPAILLIGLVLGMGAGVGSASLKEFSDTSVRTADALEAATSMVVLAGIPEIVTEEDISRVKKQRMAWLIGIVLFIIVGLVAIHFLVMDLDVLWARLMRRLAL